MTPIDSIYSQVASACAQLQVSLLAIKILAQESEDPWPLDKAFVELKSIIGFLTEDVLPTLAKEKNQNDSPSD